MSLASFPAPIVITSGEPAGVGPDLCVQLAAMQTEFPLVVIVDKKLLLQRAAQLGLNFNIQDYLPARTQAVQSGSLNVIHIPLATSCLPGKLNTGNSKYVLALLERAVQGCLTGEFAGMVTAPVHKGIINEAGIQFTGHTEFLAQQTNTQRVVMMLIGGGMRVALVTTHLPLREVSSAISGQALEEMLRIIQRDLRRYFGISSPRILVAGLNPHAGEGGYLGREEIEVIIPVLNKLRTEGFNVSEPLPADSLFTPGKLAQCDCVLTMYHDQGLPVLKHASFGQGVNVTLGLPIIRTSVDHGTALDLAGSDKVNKGSLLEAIKIAAQMAQHEHA